MSSSNEPQSPAESPHTPAGNSHANAATSTWLDTSTTPSDVSWGSVLSSIRPGATLSTHAVRWAMSQIMSGQATDAQIAAFAFGLISKGISADELAAAADAMRSFALPVDATSLGDTVDIVGTGGDGHHTVNVSTMASFVLVGSGVKVVKHGNRAASSQCGGADLLQELGYRIERDPSEILSDAHSHGFGFMFARTYHPSMRFAGPVRAELKAPTVFNLLGPLTNPATPRFGLIGCAFADLIPVMAGAFATRGDRVLVVRGSDGMDEITVTGPTTVCATNSDGSLTEFEISPADFGFSCHDLDALRGGDAAHNAAVARDLLNNHTPGAVREAVLMNAAAARATVVGWGDATDAASIKAAIIAQLPIVEESLLSGNALQALTAATR